MQSITSDWLYERGGLHDARVADVRTFGPVLEIALDDEWANERGLGRPEGQKAPGVLVIQAFLATDGEPDAITGGWISEITISDDQLNLLFCDRPVLHISMGAAWWRSET